MSYVCYKQDGVGANGKRDDNGGGPYIHRIYYRHIGAEPLTRKRSSTYALGIRRVCTLKIIRASR